MTDDSKKETSWTQSITNETLCQYFYVVFFITAVLAAIAVGMDVLLVFKRPALGLSMLIRSAPVLILSVLNSLFLYILCARTLLK
jgi:preprotein translocase subunit SecE